MCEIVYEDNHVLVVVKPPNLLTQADATGDPDLLTLMKAYIKRKYQKPGDAYLGLVHRMDRPVGGLLAMARTSKAAARLSRQVLSHEMRREYLAACQGEAPASFTLTDWLWKDEGKNLVSVAPPHSPGAKLAVLHGERLAVSNGLSLCHILLETGRAHQIRVQLAAAGRPLWGDNRYGSGKPGQQIALWGARLTLSHHTTKEKMIFYSNPQGGVWEAFAPAVAAFLEGAEHGKAGSV